MGGEVGDGTFEERRAGGALLVGEDLAVGEPGVVIDGGVDNPFTYLGRFGIMQEGETGLYLMRRRVYDSRTQRFLSRDPLGNQLHPQLVNPYQYAAQNPMRYIDPLGEDPVEPRYEGSTLDNVVGTTTSYTSFGGFVIDQPLSGLSFGVQFDVNTHGLLPAKSYTWEKKVIAGLTERLNDQVRIYDRLSNATDLAPRSQLLFLNKAGRAKDAAVTC